MPAPGSSWSRSEWLRRLGFKTGQEPPLVTTIQPTLGSGDASELLPPLLAPQGWVAANTAAGGAGTYSALELVGAIGGSFMQPDITHAWYLAIEESRPAAFTPGAAPLSVDEIEGVTSIKTEGVFSALPTNRVVIGVFAGATLQEFIGPQIYIRPSARAYVIQSVANSNLGGAIKVRDVPVGLAAD